MNGRSNIAPHRTAERGAVVGAPSGESARGFSIIELLIAIIIIGILVTIIVPRLADRAEEAKVTKTEQDLQIIQGALEQVVIDTSYLVRLYVLDDVPGPTVTDGIAPGAAGDQLDTFADVILAGGPYSAYGNQVFIESQVARFGVVNDRLASPAESTNLFNRLNVPETDFGAWGGPYLTYQRDANEDDIGDDPWGNNYLLFTPEGLVDDQTRPGWNAPSGNVVTTKTINGNSYAADVFDRFTVLSTGPNGLPGDGTAGGVFGTGDDIWRSF